MILFPNHLNKDFFVIALINSCILVIKLRSYSNVLNIGKKLSFSSSRTCAVYKWERVLGSPGDDEWLASHAEIYPLAQPVQ